MDQTQLLGTLLSLVEEQTQTNTQLQTALKAQIIALSEATKVANQTVEAVKQAAKDVNPAVKIGAEKAVTSGIGESLNGIAGETKTALEEALKPIIGDLVGAARSANQVEEKLNRVTATFGRKWTLVTVGTGLALVVVISLFTWGTVWYQRYQIEQLSAQKAALTSEVVKLQVNVDQLAKQGGKITLVDCGGRLCIEATSKNPGTWTRKDGELTIPLTIPRGY